MRLEGALSREVGRPLTRNLEKAEREENVI
jgi:hypothetical protein